MSFLYITLHFQMITITLETKKVTHIISSRMCITQRHVPGQRSCLRQAIAQQNAFISVFYKLSRCAAHLHRVMPFFFPLKSHCFLKQSYYLPWNL